MLIGVGFYSDYCFCYFQLLLPTLLWRLLSPKGRALVSVWTAVSSPCLSTNTSVAEACALNNPLFFLFSVWGTLNAAWDPDQRRACVSGAVLDSQTALKILPSQLCCREWGLAEERVLTWHHLPQEGATMSLDTFHFLAHFSLRRRIVFSCW